VRLDLASALYEWNYPKQLLHIKLGETSGQSIADREAQIFSEAFLLERPLLRAIRAPRTAVLLIDEVDRSDEEFEAFLLEVLSEHQVTIPEIGTVRAAHERESRMRAGPPVRCSQRCTDALQTIVRAPRTGAIATRDGNAADDGQRMSRQLAIVALAVATACSTDDAAEPAVATFFKDILVMADDPRVRDARLRLMKRLERLILQLGDISEIVASESGTNG
jgi:hypothetical protein